MKILDDAKKAAGCDYISDLRYLDKWIVPVFKELKWEEYSADDIKRLMCYFFYRRNRCIHNSSLEFYRRT